jgi:hypothetical protein
MGVTKDEDRPHAKDCDSVLEACSQFRRDDVSRNAGDEDLSDGLIEEQLDGDA